MDNLVISGISISIESGNGTVTQRYSPRNSGGTIYLANGGILVQFLAGNVGKVLTEISGSDGWAPPALLGLDFTIPHVVKCIQSRAVSGTSTTISISSKRRSDTGYSPKGYAIVSNSLVSTPLVMDVDEATLTAVAEADSYEVHYWPEITAMLTLNNEILDLSGPSFGWTLTCTEV
jgi:hypothetical protein